MFNKEKAGKGFEVVLAAAAALAFVPSQAEASRHETPNRTAAHSHCRRLVADAWALVRAGKDVDQTFNTEEVLECIPTPSEIDRFTRAMDRVDAKLGKGQSGTGVVSLNK